MPCNSDGTLSSSILSASASYNITGGFTARLSVTNRLGTITTAYECKPINVSVEITAEACGDVEGGLDCFSGTLPIIAGVVNDVGTTYNLDSIISDLELESYAHRLNSKPINTERFGILGANYVLTQVNSLYAGIPSALTDFNAVENAVLGPITGSNTFGEMTALAQAGYSYLFIQVGGILTAEPWKSCEDAEETIPCNAIERATRLANQSNPPSVVRVRGAFIDTFGCSESLSDVSTAQVNSGVESAGGNFKVCTVAGISADSVDVQISNLKGSSKDLKNATVSSSKANIEEDTKKFQNGSISFKARGSGLSWRGQGADSFFVGVTGSPERNTEQGYFYNKTLADVMSFYSNSLNTMKNFFSGGPWFLSNGYRAGFGSGFGFGGSASLSPNEGSRIQIEAYAYDQGLIDKFGVREDSIENPYVVCKEQLFHIAVRRIQQWKMEQNAWDLDLNAIMPCLRINQMIEFQTPATKDKPSETVKGVVAGLSYNWNPVESKYFMKVGVLGVADLCGTVYESSNLISTSCASGGEGSPWTSSGPGQLSFASLSNECGVLGTSPSFGVAWLQLNQECMEVGGDYTVCFTAEYIQAGILPSLTFKVTDSGGTPIATSPVITGDGLYCVTFNPTTTTTIFRWDLVTVGTNAQFWQVCNPSLVKRYTA